jgi:polar amino acid transport system substrate-binding protein
LLQRGLWQSCGVTRRGAHWPALLLLGVAAAAVGPAQAREDTLRVSVNEANGRPYALYDQRGVLAGGLARDIIGELAQGLGLRVEYLKLPRARVEAWLHADRIDAACFLAPAWVNEPQALRWSPVLFHIRQVIVSPPGAPPVAAPQVLFGKRLGTLLNYSYPELQPYFADGRIRRADAPSFASNIAKLARGRIEAFLNDDIAALYAAQAGQLPSDARIDPLWAEPNPVYCAFSPAFAARAPRWHALLQAQVDSGRIERAIGAYTGGRRATLARPTEARR